MYIKFQNKFLTADNKKRAFIETEKIKTLWFNTGTLCNLACKGCYIESSPKNDRLAYLSFNEFKSFVNESIQNEMGTEKIGFTGGEPFMNKDIFKTFVSGFFYENCKVFSNSIKHSFLKKT